MEGCGSLTRSAIRLDRAGAGSATDGLCPSTAEGALRSPIRLISEPWLDRKSVEGSTVLLSADGPVDPGRREYSGFAPSGVSAGPAERPGAIWRCGAGPERVPCRRAAMRSNIELREKLLLSERLDDGVCDVEFGLLLLPVPIRVPILSAPLKLESPL